MEWPTSSFPGSQEESTHPDRFPIGQFLFPQSSAAPVIEPRVCTVNPTGDGNIPPQGGGVAQTAQAPFAYDEIPAESLDLLYASTRITGGQPLRLPVDWTDTNADTNPTWLAPNSAMSHQPHPAPGSPPIFECKWRGCSSSTRFSTEGDLVRHLKSIHISPDAAYLPD
ncbi:hypothetical protein BO79DRAFT_225287 [Aspergillus costaricaensis CBS 115574]|uniref:Uncharacterized protein n=1 Tax=Aspergillus costaricaensis CBS 115574 TaxID=1448317 RepID=A0ACD1IPM3_9EURO|nr:hypothetical protein BO79DRAFT_225287 [Aspergillus costaricaensis CBS 115574]RAK92211.1 hypothetical protein BO79DRAFT_225287 [Aspergillus costaricaensis CBS 115574]